MTFLKLSHDFYELTSHLAIGIMLINGIADSRYELIFRLKSQNLPSSRLIARSKS